MARFIKNVFLFALFVVFLLFVLLLGTQSIVRKKSIIKVKNEAMVVIGHSHPECAFNDSLIKNFANLAYSGEPYFYSYQKVKKVLSQNKRTKTIFIEFSNNTIDSHMDDWIWGDEKMPYFFPIYFPFMTLEDMRYPCLNNFKGFVDILFVSTKMSLLKVLHSDYKDTSYIGGYLYLKRHKVDSLIKIQEQEKRKVGQVDLSLTNLRYLHKIIQLCKKKNIQPYLIRCPQHELSPQLKNEELFMKIKKDLFGYMDFLDFNNFPLSNQEFGDLDHLNHFGAKVFSTWFQDIIEKGLLAKENKQEFINKEMDKVRLNFAH